MNNILEELKLKCHEQLSQKRYEHVLRVSQMVKKLSNVYVFDHANLQIAVFLHDLYKEMEINKQKEIIIKYYPKYLHENHEIFHGKVAAYYAKNIYNIQDNSIIEAVEYHTTGKKGMNLETKILLIGDFIEEGRTFKGIDEIRNLALHGKLDEALIKMFEHTFRYLKTRGLMISRDSILAYNELINKSI